MKMRIACLLLALLALNVTSLLMGAVPLLFRISVAKSAKVSLPFFQADNR
ncbi:MULTISPECIES: hypothetical protein [unclassified Raoultella]|nr:MULTISPECIES: hypothetical protein [unclassified Raoultella]